jgi:AcrR family transcriptional regulator
MYTVATRAGVSEDVFHEAFSTVEDCYRAAFDEGLRLLSQTVAEATARHQAWLERVRSGLVALLGFFDDEAPWARLLVLETPMSAATTFECITGLHNLLEHLLQRSDEGTDCLPTGRAGVSPMLMETLTGELVVGGVLSVIRASMLEQDGGKLVELAPSLMAFIVTPYLGRAVAQAELEGKTSDRGLPTTTEPELTRANAKSELTRAKAVTRANELPVRATHRTSIVLQAIARAPYSNNREIAQAAGLADEGQTSKLLARLGRKGVIENVGVGPARGEPNAWLLTAEGQRMLELLGKSVADRPERRPDGRVRGAL